MFLLLMLLSTGVMASEPPISEPQETLPKALETAQVTQAAPTELQPEKKALSESEESAWEGAVLKNERGVPAHIARVQSLNQLSIAVMVLGRVLQDDLTWSQRIWNPKILWAGFLSLLSKAGSYNLALLKDPILHTPWYERDFTGTLKQGGQGFAAVMNAGVVAYETYNFIRNPQPFFIQRAQLMANNPGTPSINVFKTNIGRFLERLGQSGLALASVYMAVFDADYKHRQYLAKKITPALEREYRLKAGTKDA